jgi:hypothetical protein
MQVGVKDLAFAQHLAFDRLRLLHLHDHVGLGEDFLGRRNNSGPSLLVIVIRVADTGTGIGLHHHPVAMAVGFIDRGGRHAHAILMVLDFFRHADEHFCLSQSQIAEVTPAGTGML